jgi:integrase
MASIANDPGGKRRILFLDKNGDRKTIWLGKVSKRTANEIKTWVEAINTAAIAGHSIDGETAKWLADIGDALHAKLTKVGLVTPRQLAVPVEPTRLGAFLESYIVGRTDIKPRTRINLDLARRRLVEHFGADKALSQITAGDADAWVIWLKSQYADGTAGRTIKRAKQFFRAAIRKEIIGKNPFADAKAPSQVNEARKFFVTLDAAYAVLDACPDAEWRLIFALSRFGGLRCPSEHLALTWPDVDWERDRFRVVSSKQEHLEGGGVRWVPIFAELRPYLEEAFDLAPEGAVHVINRYRDGDQNLRTQLQRIIRRAGLEPWPKPFQNLRATRETELAEIFPVHVVCAWIGNTERIAAKHYLQVTEEHFALATRTHSAPYIAPNAKTSQNTSQHRARTEHAPNAETPAEPGLTARSPAFSAAEGYPQGDSNPCLSLERAMS